MALGAFTANAAPPPLRAFLDPVVWVVYALVALVGAFSAISVILASRHVRQSPRWLWGTLAGLLLLSLPLLSSDRQKSRQMDRFLATADSVQGVVANKYVRGGIRLVVEYRADGQTYRVTRTGANPHLGTPAFRQWERGDSIRVYYQPQSPQRVLVGRRSPDRRLLLESLVKMWGVWSVLLTAYLPLAVGRLRRGLLSVRARLHPRFESSRTGTEMDE